MNSTDAKIIQEHSHDIYDVIRVVELLKRNKSSLYQYQDLTFRRTVNEEDNPEYVSIHDKGILKLEYSHGGVLRWKTPVWREKLKTLSHSVIVGRLLE
jgi:hypothetical protein